MGWRGSWWCSRFITWPRAKSRRSWCLWRARGVALVTYSPLLTGKYTPDRAAIPAGTRFHVKPCHANIYFKPENFQTVERLRRLSDATGLSMARPAMSGVLENPHLASVLVGGRSPEHIANALAALAHPLPAVWKAEMDAWSATEIPPP
jgi:aryl-alcohol dehydrogenase-like predicted oxidoreductase